MNNQNIQKIRTRFAPSPTGFLHVGGLRTALYNYLFAKKHGGEFILRLEDTDTARTVPGSANYIVNALNWLGITPDAGYGFSKDSWNYQQSVRNKSGIYIKYAQQLIDTGWAYYAFDTPEELDAMRQKFGEDGGNIKLPDGNGLRIPTGYSFMTRVEMNNSLVLPDDIVKQRIANGESYVIRFRNPGELNNTIIVDDLIRGKVEFSGALMDDKVLVKADGMPTYHLAHLVDDIEMNITHVIRGEEWLPSAPLHVMLYQALGINPPTFAHLPLVLKPVPHKGKLSKRDGANLGITIFPFNCTDDDTGQITAGYVEQGYYSQAVVNMMALLGWNLGSGSEKEIFSMDELIQEFDLSNVHKGGAKYNPDKAKWFNQQYLRMKSDIELANELRTQLYLKGHMTFSFPNSDENILTKAVKMVRHKVSFAYEIYDNVKYVFEMPTSYDMDILRKNLTPEMLMLIAVIDERFIGMPELTEQNVEKTIDELSIKHNQKPGTVKQTLMVMLYGQKSGPGLYPMIALFGALKVKERIFAAYEYYQMNVVPVE